MGLTRLRAEQISDIDYKQAVRVITVTDITNLSGGAPSQVDGVNLSVGDRILVTAQDPGSENGIYQVQTVGTGSNGTWIRSLDTNATGELEAGTIVMVTEGTAYADTQWKLTTNNPIIIGTTPLTFVQNSADAFGNIYANGTAVLANTVGSVLTLTPGNNIEITGNNTTKTVTIGVTGISLNSISNGTSNVNVVSSGGNVTVGIGGTSNVAEFSTGGLRVTGFSSASGNVSGGNLITGGVVTATGNVAGNNFIGNVLATTISASGNVVGGNITTAGLITAAGNVIAGNLTTSGLITATGTITSATNITGGNLLTSGLISATSTITSAANITGGNLRTTGLISATSTITSAANITGGNLVTAGLISATGNITGGNILTVGQISATGNVTGNYYIGNGAFLTGLSAGTSNAIANGATRIDIPVSSGNIAMSVAGQSNTVVISLGTFSMYGTFATPKLLEANVEIAPDTNAVLFGPVEVGAAYNIAVPTDSTLYIIGSL